MKRIGILTAGGDTPALNATICGAVVRACQRKIEVFGFIKGFSSLFNPRVPHVRLNPLFTPIPELDTTRGGTIIGASRDYVDADDTATIAEVVDRLKRLHVEGLICIGGDGTLNGMQALSDFLHPLHGGPSGDGWDFGRAVYLSDVAVVLESVDGMDHAESIQLVVNSEVKGEFAAPPPDQIVVAGIVRLRVKGPGN